MKILANDGIDNAGKAILSAAGITVDTQKIPQEALIEQLQAYDGIVVRSATTVRKALIDACPNLKVIGRAGVGMDNIDVAYAIEKGIRVINTPAASSRSVAELVFAHLLSLCRFLHLSNREMPSEGHEKFNNLKKNYSSGIEVYGKTLGLVGFGRIGQETAKIALGLGMQVCASDMMFEQDENFKLNMQAAYPGIQLVGLEELLQIADFISIHTPAVKSPIISLQTLSLLKPGVGIINCARGGIVEEDALLVGLNNGIIRFAGLDVFENEPKPLEALLNHPLVSVTPHIGASTLEAQERVGIELAEKIVAALL